MLAAIFEGSGDVRRDLFYTPALKARKCCLICSYCWSFVSFFGMTKESSGLNDKAGKVKQDCFSGMPGWPPGYVPITSLGLN